MEAQRGRSRRDRTSVERHNATKLKRPRRGRTNLAESTKGQELAVLCRSLRKTDRGKIDEPKCATSPRSLGLQLPDGLPILDLSEVLKLLSVYGLLILYTTEVV